MLFYNSFSTLKYWHVRPDRERERSIAHAPVRTVLRNRTSADCRLHSSRGLLVALINLGLFVGFCFGPPDSVPMPLTTRQNEQLKCAGFYLGLLVFILIIVVWNILEGPEKNVFVKMANPGQGEWQWYLSWLPMFHTLITTGSFQPFKHFLCVLRVACCSNFIMRATACHAHA